MKIRLAACALLLASLTGCLSFANVSQGIEIDPEAVGAISEGTSLQEVLELLGAPLEVHKHVDGRLLVYRHRKQNTARIDVSVSRALQFIDLTQVTSELASNLQLTIQRTHAGEDRVVILFDKDYRVKALGYRTATADLPVF